MDRSDSPPAPADPPTDAPPPLSRSEEDEQEILAVDTNAEVIEIHNVRLFKLSEIDLSKLIHCRVLSLRKNLLHDLEPIPADLGAHLVELDLFDNKIRSVVGMLGACVVLTKVDLSYNQLGKIEGFEGLGETLVELYLIENKIKVVEGLETLRKLKLLELGGNGIRTIGDGLRHLTALEQLWLGKNKITTIGTAFQTLSQLRRLSLQANRLTSIPPEVFPPGALPLLEELYLSENDLSCIENVRHLPSLTLLDYSFNPIATINADEVNPRTMPRLEEFWLTDGKVDAWSEVDKLAPFAATMRTVYLERNPIEADKRYRDKVFAALPFLTQIDSWPIVNRSNPEADRAANRRD